MAADQAPGTDDETTAPTGPPAEAVPHLRADDTAYLEVVEAVDADRLLVPWTGEVVDANDAHSCIRALASVRHMEAQVAEAKRGLTEAIVEQSGILGTKTITLDDGRKGVVSGTSETVYDAQGLERELRAAGMPETRIREIVVEEVSYKVVAVEAKKAAAANPAYREIIERNRTVHDKKPYVSLSGFGL